MAVVTVTLVTVPVEFLPKLTVWAGIEFFCAVVVATPDALAVSVGAVHVFVEVFRLLSRDRQLAAARAAASAETCA